MPTEPAVPATVEIGPSTPDAGNTATEDDDEYAHLVPLQRRYAQMSADDPARSPEAIHAAEAYRSFSLDEMLHGGQTTVADKFIGNQDIHISLVDDRETLRPLLAELGPRERTILALRFFHHCT